MRRLLLLAPLLLYVPPAHADGVCGATAETPQTAGAHVWASGRFFCSPADDPHADMSVTVCIESTPVLLPLVWTTESCTTETDAGPTRSVTAMAVACVQTPTPVLVRTTAAGSNADGDTGSTTSAPTWAPGFGSCGP